MPRSTQHSVLVSLLALTLACASPTESTSPAQMPDFGLAYGRDPGLVVYSHNVYVGTDVDAVLAAPPEEVGDRVFAALGTFIATDWPARAGVIADAIGRSRADLVALNEVTTLTVQGLEPYFPNLTVEFLPILQAALAARGLNYDVAGIVANTDANLSLGGPQIRLQDFDVVLVRSGVMVSNVVTANYQARVPVSLGPLGDLTILRGRVQIDANVDGRMVRFVATHLEPIETSPLLQASQASELISALAGSPIPVIVAGDLNSEARDPNPASPYAQFRAAGFLDVALTSGLKRPANTNTCCYAPDLVTPSPTLTRRIDHILTRSDERRGGPESVGARAFELIGDEASERTASGLWPSDHAGVIVHFGWRANGNFAGR